MKRFLLLATLIAGCDNSKVARVINDPDETIWFESDSKALDHYVEVNPGANADGIYVRDTAIRIFPYHASLLNQAEIDSVKQIEMRVNVDDSVWFCPDDPGAISSGFAAGQGTVWFCPGHTSPIAHELGHTLIEIVHGDLGANFEENDLHEGGAEIFKAFSFASPKLPASLPVQNTIYNGHGWHEPKPPCTIGNDWCYRHKNGEVLERVAGLVYSGAQIGVPPDAEHPNLKGVVVQQDLRPDLRLVRFLRETRNVEVNYDILSLLLPAWAGENFGGWSLAFCLSGLPSFRPECSDPDSDGFVNLVDNCPTVANPPDFEFGAKQIQRDRDLDGIGDECSGDIDGDNIPDGIDPCPRDADDGKDTDGDGLGDACDEDADGDGWDDDGIPGDDDKLEIPRDNCAGIYNPDQLDSDGDGKGDVCDEDSDSDGIENHHDNCPFVVNPGQENQDGDEFGDACDPDRDGDCIDNATDNCPLTATCPAPNKLCKPCIMPDLLGGISGLLNKCVSGGVTVDPRCMIDGCSGTPLGDFIQVAAGVGGPREGLPIGIRGGRPYLISRPEMRASSAASARFGAFPMQCYGLADQLGNLQGAMGLTYDKCMAEKNAELVRCNPTTCGP
jgi:hypothetical protein